MARKPSIGILGQSGHVMMLAKKACERCATEPFEALSAILLSMIGFECFLNELEERLQQEKSGPHKSLSDLGFTLRSLAESRASMVSRIEAIHYFLSGSKVDWGKLPYQ